MFSGSVDAGFILELPFHHGDLVPDCVGVSTRGGGEHFLSPTCVKMERNGLPSVNKDLSTVKQTATTYFSDHT